MDPGTAVGVVSLGIQVCQGLIDYYKDWRGYEKDIEALAASTESLLKLLENIHETLEDVKTTGQDVGKKLLQHADEAAQNCQQNVQALQSEMDAVNKYQDKKDIRSKLQHHLRHLLYPFRKGRLQDLNELVDIIRSHLTNLLNVLQLRKVTHVEKSVNETKEIVENLERATLRKDAIGWLSAPDPFVNHQEAIKKRHGDTGQWFLDREEYVTWKTDDNSFLWIHGFMGCGKTILVSTIITDMQNYCSTRPESVCAFYYFTFSSAALAGASGLAKAIVLQISQQIPTEGSVPLHESSTRSRYPDDKFVLEILRSTIGQFKNVFLIVDALDECSNKETLCQSLDIIRGWDLKHLHILVTGRDDVELRDGIDLSISGKRLSLQTMEQDKDIRDMISKTLATDKRLKRWSTQKSMIEERLASGAKGMFRWVECQLDRLRRCRTPNEIKRTLDTLPLTLEATYADIWKNVSSEDSHIVVRLLQWVCYSERPMTFNELRDALAVELPEDGSGTSVAVFDSNNRFDRVEDLLTLCPNFLTISNPILEEYDYGIPTSDSQSRIHLAHFSVKEFLTSQRSGSTLQINTPHAYQTMVITCLTYLIAPQEPDKKQGEEYLDRLGEKFPFIWHATEELGPLIPKVGSCRHWIKSAKILLSSKFHHRLYWQAIFEVNVRQDWENLTPLHTAAVWGDLGLVQELVSHDETGPDKRWQPVHMRFVSHWPIRGLSMHLQRHRANSVAATPLHLAALFGNSAVVSNLISRNAHWNGADYAGDPPSVYSVIGDHIGCLQILLADVQRRLKSDIQSDSTAAQDELNRVLHTACEFKRIEAISIAMELGASRTSLNHGRTPLMLALRYNNYPENVHLNLVKRLWYNGAESWKDAYHNNLLNYAISWTADSEVLEWLLRRTADIDLKNNNVLLRHGADGRVRDYTGRSALHLYLSPPWWIGHDLTEIVKLLIDHGASPASRDKRAHLTPLVSEGQMDLD